MRISDWSSDVCSSDLLIAATAGLFWATPTGFIPAQDQGYFLVVAKLPSGASVERTDEVLQKVARRVLPVDGVLGSVMLAGFDGPSPTLAPNSAAAIGRASCRKECVRTGRSRWSPYH